MKPYGRDKKVKANWKRNEKLPKGYQMWWEGICSLLPRATIKKNWKKRELNELD